MPTVFPDILLNEPMREHRQHKLSPDLCKRIEQVLKILLVERAIVMPAITSHIGRIDKMECPIAIITADKIRAILAFNGHILQARTQLLGKGIFGIAQFL